jgi:hypothetical protein
MPVLAVKAFPTLSLTEPNGAGVGCNRIARRHLSVEIQ